jgi:hypothetical protein
MKKTLLFITIWVLKFSYSHSQNDHLDTFALQNSTVYARAVAGLDLLDLPPFDKILFYPNQTNKPIALKASINATLVNNVATTDIAVEVNDNLKISIELVLRNEDDAEIAIMKKTGGDVYEIDYDTAKKKRIKSDKNEYLEGIRLITTNCLFVLKNKMWVTTFKIPEIDGMFMMPLNYKFQ